MGVRGPAAGRGWGGFACSRVIRTTSVLVLVLAWVLGAGVSEARTAAPSGIPTATWVEQAPIPTWFDIQGIDAQADYKIPTESMGAFNIGGSVTRFTKFDQFIKGGPKFSVLGTTGFNNTFPVVLRPSNARCASAA